MKRFKEGDYHVLIATDVSARGIDIPDVDYVVNYDLPDKAENYVHRVGRTGRGVNKGVAISFCSKGEKGRLDEIQQFIDRKIEISKISKKEYAHTLETAKELSDLKEWINDHDNWEK